MRLSVSSLGRIFNRDLPIEFGSESLSSYGGLELLRRYFRLIGLHRRIRRAFNDHDLGGDYGPAEEAELLAAIADAERGDLVEGGDVIAKLSSRD